jgi:hypothetical protein
MWVRTPVTLMEISLRLVYDHRPCVLKGTYYLSGGELLATFMLYFGLVCKKW